jgi:DNA helicase-2/ATP-dependent DNA helicase PcrA
MKRFVDGGNRLYHRRLAQLLDAKGCLPALQRRLERYYDMVLVDEVQDFGGHDFNFLMALTGAQLSWRMVGDFFQHTYSTSYDGNVNLGLHDDYQVYKRRFRSQGFLVDTDSLATSHRCSATVCDFIRSHLGVEIAAATDRRSGVVQVDNQAEVDRIFADQSVLKLFYMRHDRYRCASLNWGSAKGLDHFEDVCVALSDDNWKALRAGRLRPESPLTRNKLYVACSRPRRHLYLVPEKLLKRHAGPN